MASRQGGAEGAAARAGLRTSTVRVLVRVLSYRQYECEYSILVLVHRVQYCTVLARILELYCVTCIRYMSIYV